VRRQSTRARQHPRPGDPADGAAQYIRGGPKRVVTAGVAGGQQRRGGDESEPVSVSRGSTRLNPSTWMESSYAATHAWLAGPEGIGPRPGMHGDVGLLRRSQ